MLNMLRRITYEACGLIWMKVCADLLSLRRPSNCILPQVTM